MCLSRGEGERASYEVEQLGIVYGLGHVPHRVCVVMELVRVIRQAAKLLNIDGIQNLGRPAGTLLTNPSELPSIFPGA